MKTVTTILITISGFLIIGCGETPQSNVEPIIDVDSFSLTYLEAKMQGVDTIANYQGEVCPHSCTKVKYNNRAYAILDMYDNLVLFSWIIDDSIAWNNQLELKLGLGDKWHKSIDKEGFRKYIGDGGYDVMLRAQEGRLNSMVMSRAN